jgi:hypothetical protein
MHPLPHFLMTGALVMLGFFLGALGGAGLFQSGLLGFMGDKAAGIVLIAASAGAMIPLYYFQRIVPIRCPDCGGKMTRTPLGGRRSALDCHPPGRRETLF